MIVGIDPGARSTGIVRVEGSKLLRACTITREGNARLPEATYISEVIAAVYEYSEGVDALAIESLVPPTGQLSAGKAMNVNGILGTAMVLGGVLAVWPDAIMVRPAKNGSGPMASYPELLRPTRGESKGFDNLRHTRSAWDIAQTGLRLRRRGAA